MSDLNPPVAPHFGPLRSEDGLADTPIYHPRLPVEVVVVRPRTRRRYGVHLVLLLITIFTTLVVGARMQANFANGHAAFSLADDTLSLFPLDWIAQQPSRLLLGMPFAATLMLILLAHEMGHYIYCLRYGVQATLPYFIPAPTLIGTLGAFIRIRSPIRSREALFDIGIAGPIAGFAVAIWVMFLALTLSKPMPPSASGDELLSGFPLIFQIAHALIWQGAASRVPLAQLQLHPVAIAAWVGMFATALNLLPGGQLDGGHMVYALSPRAHKHVSRFTIGVLLPMGIFLWAGWLLWAALLAISGIRHPQVPLRPAPPRSRRLLAVAALLMLILTLTPEPFHAAGVPLPRWGGAAFAAALRSHR